MPHPRATCPCCTPGPTRRGLLAATLATAAAATTRPAQASGGRYEAMLLSCIDPRFDHPAAEWMDQRGLSGRYSHFAIAGAAIAIVAPPFAAWRPAFWDNLAASIQLHRITRVIALNHRDCGAAGIAYGQDAIANPEAETALHRRVIEEFQAQLTQHQPEMRLEAGLMALDGSVERLA